jgi:hypothetical protein
MVVYKLARHDCSELESLELEDSRRVRFAISAGTPHLKLKAPHLHCPAGGRHIECQGPLACKCRVDGGPTSPRVPTVNYLDLEYAPEGKYNAGRVPWPASQGSQGPQVLRQARYSVQLEPFTHLQALLCI